MGVRGMRVRVGWLGLGRLIRIKLWVWIRVRFMLLHLVFECQMNEIKTWVPCRHVMLESQRNSVGAMLDICCCLSMFAF